MKILVCGNYGVGNLGDEALLSGLHELFTELTTDAELVAMGKGRLFPFGIRSFLRSLINWKLWARPYRLMREADIVVIGGGGLFTDEERALAGLFWALHGLVAHYLLKRPVLVLGVSSGTMGAVSSWATQRLVRVARLVSVRDRRTLKKFSGWREGVVAGPDLSYFCSEFADAQTENRPATEKYVIFALRPFKLFTENMIKICAQFADFLVQNYRYRIVFLPFDKKTGSDGHFMNKIIEQMVNKKAAIVHPFSSDRRMISQKLFGAELIYAMRLHAGIFSILSNAALIPLNYMTKSKAFWEQFGDIKALECKGLNLAELIESSKTPSSELKAHSVGAREKLGKAAAHLKTHLRKVLKTSI